MQLSRDGKNRLLIGCNALMVLICVAKWVIAPADLSGNMRIWVVIAPLILLLATAPAGSRLGRPFHAALFLLTGASIGLTMGTALKSPGALWWIEWLWLALALACAAAHYSPSQRDEYL